MVRRAQADDPEAWKEIVEGHWRQVWRECWILLRHDQDAEDATQETFRVVKEKLPEYRKTGSLSGWVVVIARNLARDELRRHRRRDVAVDVLVGRAPSSTSPFSCASLLAGLAELAI